jgi:hypothetical protein
VTTIGARKKLSYAIKSLSYYKWFDCFASIVELRESSGDH